MNLEVRKTTNHKTDYEMGTTTFFIILKVVRVNPD